MFTKGNWSYFDSLEVIITQKCSNHFENNVEKWPLLTILIITFDPQKKFEWGLFHWKENILGFNLNTKFAYVGLKFNELWPFKVGSSKLS